MDEREAARRWKKAWAEGWPAKDVDGIVRLQAEDGNHYASMFRAYEGREGLRRYVAQCFGEETEAAQVWFAEPVVDGSTAAVEYWAITYPGGNPLTISGCTVIRLDENGLVAQARDYSHVKEGSFLPPEGLFEGEQ
jgi:ketosteroid isomerase-like protein